MIAARLETIRIIQRHANEYVPAGIFNRARIASRATRAGPGGGWPTPAAGKDDHGAAARQSFGSPCRHFV